MAKTRFEYRKPHISVGSIINRMKRRNSNGIFQNYKTEEPFTEEETKLLEDIQTFHNEDVEGKVSGYSEEEDISRATKTINNFREKQKINLNYKVDLFINWCSKNMFQCGCSKFLEFQESKRLRDFIEKMAVWYELRYPDYEINRILKCTADESTNINEEMFINNPYLDDVNEEIDYFNWSEFYNTKVFIDTLPQEEKRYLRKPAYPSLIYIDKTYLAHLHLSANGIVKLSEGMGLYTQYEITDEEIEEMHIEDILTLFKEKNIPLPSHNEIIPAITSYQKKSYFYEELLNCVMYRIIERGRYGFGPRRAFLFAKEFNRNIDIPMMYGASYGVGQRNFINEYLKAGGRKDLLCYFNYKIREEEYEKLQTITVEELLKKVNHNARSKNTEEEQLLGQSLINILNSQIDEEELKIEQVKADRITRKLTKSKRRYNK